MPRSRRSSDPVAGADVVEADSSVTVRRGGRFIKAALALLGETGRTDFTVHQVVTRARASYRDFYQHFATKDELMLTLSGDIIARFTATWRVETEPLDAGAALRLLIDRVGAQPASDVEGGINSGLSLYYEHLAQTRPRDFASLLAPLHQLIRDILVRGVRDGVIAAQADSDAAAAIMMQTILGVSRIQLLSIEMSGHPIDAPLLHRVILSGILE